MLSIIMLCAACGLAALATGPSEPAADDRAQVIATVQRMFDAMRSRDAAALSAVLVPGGQFCSVRDETGQSVVRLSPFEDFVKSTSSGPSTKLERMWDPDVRVSGRIATLTAPYDFHLDGAFSHCGTDVFELVNDGSMWRIAGGVYTVERTGCSPSPLGPPR